MKQTIYALGVFDGVHVGHAQLLQQCRALGQTHGALCGAVTFGTHPDREVLGKAPVLLGSLADRERLLKDRFAMDAVVVLPFDENMCRMPWRDFLTMLEENYHAVGFVCGEDFRFGNGGAGTASLLADYCREQGLPYSVVPEQTIHGIRVSSTYIRQLLERGELAEAIRFLGHPHVFTCPVEKSGRLTIPTGLVMPKCGTYGAVLAGTGRPMAIHIHADRTITGSEGFSGEAITLELTEFLESSP